MCVLWLPYLESLTLHGQILGCFLPVCTPGEGPWGQWLAPRSLYSISGPSQVKVKVDKLFFVGGEVGSLIKDYSLFFISSYSLTELCSGWVRKVFRIWGEGLGWGWEDIYHFFIVGDWGVGLSLPLAMSVLWGTPALSVTTPATACQ